MKQSALFRLIRRKTRRALRHERTILLLLGAVAGALTGLTAIVFRLGIDEAQALFLGVRGEYITSAILALPWWRVVLGPLLGGVAVALILRLFMADHRSRSVTHVIEAVATKGGALPLKDGLVAALISVLTLGSGGSAGREGPIVHLAATLAANIGRVLKLNPKRNMTLLGCGVASAVAASFNAPIAGAFFALEVVVGSYALDAFAPVVLASVIGTVISRLYFGDFPAFILPHHYGLVSFWEFPAFALLGIVCAIVAGLFMWSVLFAEKMADRLPLPGYLLPVPAGLAVGVLALAFPQILGVGYEATDAALKEQLPLVSMLLLLVVKTMATAITLGGRFGGGVFSPSLYLGAMTGGAFGIIAAAAFPEYAASQGVYTIVGMGAVASAVLGAPISTILIVFEMTGDYKVTIAVMLSASLASLIVHSLGARSFFHWQLRRRGIDVEDGRLRHLLSHIPVAELLRPTPAILHEQADIEAVRMAIMENEAGVAYIVDDDNRLRGVIALPDLKRFRTFEEESHHEAHAADVMRPCRWVLYLEQPLDQALDLLEKDVEDPIPVLNNKEEKALRGVIYQRDILLAQNRALVQRQREQAGEGA